MKLPLPLRFNEQDADSASDQWGMNCGPGAVAAITGMTFEELRPHLGDFESKKYTNPTLMWSILDSIGVKWEKRKSLQLWPRYGLARVQWEGPWTQPEVNPKARYRYTHWVGACVSENNGTGIFDINCMNSGGWVYEKHWIDIIVPHILKNYPRSSGKWHLTHVVEVVP